MTKLSSYWRTTLGRGQNDPDRKLTKRELAAQDRLNHRSQAANIVASSQSQSKTANKKN